MPSPKQLLLQWHTRVESHLDELQAAMEQVAVEAGWAGDEVREKGHAAEWQPAAEQAKTRLRAAVAALRGDEDPPTPAVRRPYLDSLEAFQVSLAASTFPEYAAALDLGSELLEQFALAFAAGVR
ncbi:hypothetical protein [uncultured Jatrophihabitans sp.]|uniref:hypothetical protein n=1 Tax=uncultured Jatrophihabitans sp. TaxID=1610747 RepID=UPI0035CC322E